MSSYPSPTMGEIEEYIQSFQKHEMVHVRFGFIEIKSQLVLDAWQQITRTVKLVQTGAEEAKDHRAETLLLMMFQDAVFHGYTPQKKVEKGTDHDGT